MARVEINKELVFFNDNSKTREELFKKVENFLTKLNFVKQGYSEALIKRENQYPTGIKIGDYGIAVAHTDASYILKSDVLFCKLIDSIEFSSMETNEVIDVNFVFILLLENGEDHLQMLQKIALTMQDGEFLEQVIRTQTKEELCLLLIEKMK